MRVNFKIMSQNFNPSTYSETGSTSSIMDYRFTTDLSALQTFSMKFSMVENFIMFFDNWFVDIGDFAFFIQSYLDNAPKMNIRTYDFSYLGTSTFAKKYQLWDTYGYLSFDWS